MNPQQPSDMRAALGSFSCRDGFEMPSWSVRPATDTALPGVLFVYEPFGINPEMQRVASELARAGYVVMIPDLMKRGSFVTCMRRLMKSMAREEGGGIDDLLDARAALVGREDVVADRIGVVGLCLGGGFALVLAKTGLFRASAPFYGRAPNSIVGACPIVASYGGRDRMTGADAHRLRGALEQLAIPHDFKTYDHSGHSFMTRPANAVLRVLGPILPGHAAYDPEAAADATRRLIAFFARHV